VVRGALYALLLDARLRDKSGGKRSLDDLLRTLFEEARKAQAPLSPRAFTDAVSETLGEQALTLDQRTLRGDTPIVLPANALGHCFAPRKQTVTPFVLGLTESADETGRTTVQHAAGPAAAAGLHDGDEIRGLVYQPGDPRVKVRLEAKRDGGWHKLSYLPAGKPIAVQGFVKKPGLSDDDCLQRDPSTR
jgi:predicted metalloprotease with PDZ domain